MCFEPQIQLRKLSTTPAMAVSCIKPLLLLEGMDANFVKTGEDALTGQEEIGITHRFPPDHVNSRRICFKGLYLSIYNEKTKDRKTFEENVSEYKEFEVPAGYTCYVRVATVYFVQN